MTEKQMDPETSTKHNEARLKRWISSVGTITLPLLAGFSITSVVVVVGDDPKTFRWPGATILVLALAAVTLVVAVQCAYHAHVYLSKNDPKHEKGLKWARRTRWFYDFGLFAVLAGLALIVVPPRSATGAQAGFRCTAFWVACAACLGEFIWLVVDPWLRSALGVKAWHWWRVDRTRCERAVAADRADPLGVDRPSQRRPSSTQISAATGSSLVLVGHDVQPIRWVSINSVRSALRLRPAKQRATPSAMASVARNSSAD